MDSRIPDIKPLGLESWVMPEHVKESRTITPVPENEGGSFNKMSSESSSQQKEGVPAISREEAKELAESAQSYLDDLNIGVTFDLHEKTGELIVQVINRDTKELIRQIPPEELVKLHDNLKDLCGALFSGKA